MALPMRSAGAVPEWTLADRLRKAREHAGLSQAELREVTGLAHNTISNYERSATAPRRPQLLLWALATGVSLEWLTGEPTDPDGRSETECPPWDSNPEPAD